MKNQTSLNRLFLLGAVFLLCSVSYSQDGIRIPAPSPGASVSQVVGVTKITIDYSSPGVKGRKIWGDLEAYDKAWRAGANAATKITFQDDVVIEGKNVKAGSYSLFITPKEKDPWLVHINTGSSVFAYNKDNGEQDMEKLIQNDVVTIKVTPNWTNNVKERLAYSIELVNQTEPEALVTMNWEKAEVSFTVKIAEAKNLIIGSIEKSSNSNARQLRSAANYFYNNGNIEKAEEYVDKSLALRSDYFWSKWLKSRILFKNSEKEVKKKDAKKLKEKAKEMLKEAISLGEANPDGAYNFFKPQLQKDLEEWQK